MSTIKLIFRFGFVILLLFNKDSIAQKATQRNLLQKATNEQQLKTELLTTEQWVPYPAYKDRAGWERFLGAYKKEMISEGEKSLDYQWQVVKAMDYLEYSKSGSRLIMETPHGRNINAISNLFLAEMAEGKGRFINQLINGVYAVCEMTTWSSSAHLSLQLKHKTFPDHNQQIIDLVSGDLGSMFSWIYYFLHKEFDKENRLIATRLKHEIDRRILQPYMNIDHLWWMGFSGDENRMINNWNPWCNSNVLQAFALMEPDKDKLAMAVYRTMKSIDKFINYAKYDGACEEGSSYWGHAAGKLYDYLQILYDITGGKVSLFDHPLIKNMGEYISRSYVGNGWVVNFADASAKGGGDAALIYRYGKAVNSNEMKNFAAYLLKQNGRKLSYGGGRDMFRTLQNINYNKEVLNIEPLLPNADYTWYPQTEVCYIKKEQYFLAAKGGFNNESHNHNDVGTFSLYVDTIPFFIDVGVGTYTRQTFSSERHSIWTMQSNYHNLPLINGVAQSNGTMYKSKHVSFNNAKSKFSIDISDAYKKEAAVKKWQRTYSLSDEGLVIEENFELSEIKAPSIINFLIWAQPNISIPGIVVLIKNDKKVVLSYNPKKFEATVDAIPQEDKRLSNVWGNEIYRLSLISKKPKLKGKHKFIIKNELK